MTTIKLLKKIEGHVIKGRTIHGKKYKWPLSVFNDPDVVIPDEIIPDKIVEVTYQVPYVNGRSLRNSDAVAALIEKARKGEAFNPEEIDRCCEWFCGLFQNQFTVDELLDGYDVDSLMPDIFAAYMAIAGSAMKTLTEFPILPAAEK